MGRLAPYSARDLSRSAAPHRAAIAADVRQAKDGRTSAKLKLLAGLLGVNYDDLKQRDNERRIRRLRFVVAAALVLVSGFAALSVYAWRQKQTARGAQSLAEKEKSRAQLAQEQAEKEKARAEEALLKKRAALSQSDFLAATRSLEAGRVSDALAQLARSLSFNPRNEASLFRLTTLLTYRNFAASLQYLKVEGQVQSAQLPPDPEVSESAKSILGKNAPTWDAEKQAPPMH